MTEGLWAFSNRVYAVEGVADACLRLQDRHGADVNLVMFCCWAGLTSGDLPEGTLREALAISSDWTTNAVGPLRQARTWLKATVGDSPLRDRIKRDELDAEQLEQQRLESLVGAPTVTENPGVDAVRANLHRGLAHTGIGADPADRADLELIVRATLGMRSDACGGNES